MTRWARAYVQNISWLNEKVGTVLGALVLVLMGNLLYQAFMRNVFNAPPVWGLESQQFILGYYFIIGGGYALLHGAHVRMDVLYDRWSLRRKALVDIATFSLAIIYFVVLIWAGGIQFIEAVLNAEVSHSVWGPPLAPIKFVIPFGGTLFLLQAIAFFIQDIYILRGKKLLQ